jgi:hypothetical protein
MIKTNKKAMMRKVRKTTRKKRRNSKTSVLLIELGFRTRGSSVYMIKYTSDQDDEEEAGDEDDE